MKIHRFYNKQPLGEENIKLESKNNKELLHQFFTVLKFKIDEEIILFNNDLNNLKNNFDYIYKIKNINKNICELELINTKENLSQIKEIKKDIVLCQTLIKKDNFDFVLQKCTELGVLKFIPIISERVEKKNILSFNKERSEKIIIEACEQSG
jgi:16S rRNA (uracil1498-N3)-methyltransferase